jgi:uncharacterized protein (DUF1330 family)
MKTKYTVALTLLAGVAIGGLAVHGLHAQSKPPVYLVAEIEVSNLDGYVKEYAPLVQAAIKAGGGRILAVGQNATSIEGAAPAKRVAIQQWESMEQVNAYRKSEAFAKSREVGNKYAKFRTWAIEGLSQ